MMQHREGGGTNTFITVGSYNYDYNYVECTTLTHNFKLYRIVYAHIVHVLHAYDFLLQHIQKNSRPSKGLECFMHVT